MLGPHTITVLHPAARDTWGDTQTGGTQQVVTDCFWQPISTEELTAGQDTVNTVAKVFMPPSAVVGDTDRIMFEGRTYQVDGRPAPQHTPVGLHHYEVMVREIRG